MRPFEKKLSGYSLEHLLEVSRREARKIEVDDPGASMIMLELNARIAELQLRLDNIRGVKS